MARRCNGTSPAEEINRMIVATMRDTLDAFTIQMEAGPVSEKALAELLFRAAHGVVESVAEYSLEQRGALLPSVVRMLLATFLEDVAGAESSRHNNRHYNEERN